MISMSTFHAGLKVLGDQVPLGSRPIPAGSTTATRATAPLAATGTAPNAGWRGGRDHGPARRISLPVAAPGSHPPAFQHRISV